MAKKPNLLFFGVDSLRADRMSLYGYPRLTTPHLDRWASGGIVFEHCFAPSIPTTPGYSSMLTGLDCFGTNVVALGHRGEIAPGHRTLPEILRDAGYNTSTVGYNIRGFETNLNFAGWGNREDGRSPKAESMNATAIPELKRLAAEDKPFFLFLRHMDPHTPYLPPAPFERMFYGGNEFADNPGSLQELYDFKPFRDYFISWFPPGCTDKEYMDAQYDGAVAYMDSCISNIRAALRKTGQADNTLIVLTADHGETLYEHSCHYDHHGLYEPTLTIPLAFVLPGKTPANMRHRDYVQTKDIVPTVLELLGIPVDDAFDGRSLCPLMRGEPREPESTFYLTECTWMHKHGWRTPHWKLIHALEPDFHYKPEVELYNLVSDPGEHRNVAAEEPEVVAMLEAHMRRHIDRRTRETGRPAPIYHNFLAGRDAPFASSQEAYDTLHIGDPEAARKLQERIQEREKRAAGN
ncbi:sulfatase [Candidatus Poribacteria bacterium]|nr:sulfatase [Candidatus Poribacteria bacterium]